MISGSFTAQAATRQPMAAKPAPATRHGQKQLPDTAWSTPPAGTGQGAPWAEAVTPEMSARGLILDFGHRWGHGGTPDTRGARRPFAVSRLLGRRADAAAVEEGAAQDAAARAHGDRSAAYLKGHQYAPMPQPFAGESYSCDMADGQPGPTMGARAIIHGRPGGQHSDGGPSGQFGPIAFRLGRSRRWAQARYSSPALGAMYSKNSLRGVLPQVVTVPRPQPALSGVRDSGIPGNVRALLPSFTTPALFRSPPSESEAVMAAQPPAPVMGHVMGIGF